MSPFNLLAALTVAAALSACSSYTAPYNVERLSNTEATGSAFTQTLTNEYRELAEFEAYEMLDWRDANYHALKGLQAAEGQVVEPQPIAERDLPEEHVAELTQARGDMMELFDAGARDRFPELAGRAQGRFDCWMEQQEEGHQLDHIAACREAFFAALNEMQAGMAPPPAPEPAPAPAPMAAPEETYTIFFAFDSTEVTSEGLAQIDRAVSAAQRAGAARLSVTGHADRAGPEEYNLGLSLRRAEAVRDLLIARGIDASDITIAGRGEAENDVPTADGVREPANRRVEIVVL